MKNPCVPLFALLVTGCAATGTDTETPFEHCWSETIQFESTSNFSLLCVNGSHVESLVFFPNEGPDSTVCRHAGNMIETSPNSLVIDLQRGTCENGNFMRPMEMDCDRRGRNRLTCVDADGREYRLAREVRELYGARSEADIDFPAYEEASRRLASDFMGTMEADLVSYFTRQGLPPAAADEEAGIVMDSLLDCLTTKLQIAAQRQSTTLRAVLEDYVDSGPQALYPYVGKETLEENAAGCIPQTNPDATG